MLNTLEVTTHPSDLWRLNEDGGGARTRQYFRRGQAATVLEDEALSDLDYVHEMPVANPPPVYVMIPSVRRKGDEDYLNLVLESLKTFPQSQIYVFNNARPGQPHIRWDEARMWYREVHFMRNEAPMAPGHPSIYNFSIPFPPFVQEWSKKYNETLALEARNDTDDRKEWRRKECNDFVTMSRYMLTVLDPNVPLNETWIIFNQDDALVRVDFKKIMERLRGAELPRIDLNPDGLVSVAFRGEEFAELVQHAPAWCDFIPVDWMVWSFFRNKGYCEKCGKVPKKTVEHIGKVSSRYGRVEGAEAYDQQIREEARRKAREKREKEKEKKKKEAQMRQDAVLQRFRDRQAKKENAAVDKPV